MLKNVKRSVLCFFVSALVCGNLFAKDFTIVVNSIDENGVKEEIGTVKFDDSKGYVESTTNLMNLPAGERGFHIHENPNCGVAVDANGVKQAGFAAGGHYDPHKTLMNKGPNGGGHFGDLPVLKVDSNGNSKEVIDLKSFKSVDLLIGRAIVIHSGGDNYSDNPEKLGGGKNRIACGVIK